MRIQLILWVFFLAFHWQLIGQGKQKTVDEVLFNNALEYHENNKPDTALIAFKILLDSFPNSKLIARAKYNIAYILKEQGKYEDAKRAFKEVLTKNYNEQDPSGSGAMGEQFALYKHNSCEQLADIYLKEKNFKEAEKYIRLFDKKYPYKHFCGNELGAYQIFKVINYAKLYEGQGQLDKAIKKLLPYVFYDGIAENETLLSELGSLLEKKYQIDDIKKELKLSLATLSIKDTKRRGEYGTISLFGEPVKVYDAILYDFREKDQNIEESFKLDGLEKYRKAITSNKLYKNYGLE
jgi:tetratricopeptide (TPR) repeat protein